MELTVLVIYAAALAVTVWAHGSPPAIVAFVFMCGVSLYAWVFHRPVKPVVPRSHGKVKEAERE